MLQDDRNLEMIAQLLLATLLVLQDKVVPRGQGYAEINTALPLLRVQDASKHIGKAASDRWGVLSVESPPSLQAVASRDEVHELQGSPVHRLH